MAGVVFREAQVAELLRGPQGAVAKHLGTLAIKVQSQARLNATQRPGPRVDTGRLYSSIDWAFGVDGQGIYVDVGTGVDYGRFLELGLTRNGARYPFLEPALSAIR